jgi:hypothetical protein
MIRCILLILPILLASGCATTDSYAPPTLAPHASLLFDAQGGYPRGTDIVFGQSWPAALDGFESPEVIYYHESYYDLQGRWPSSQDYTYRRFQVERSGRMIR